MRLPPEITAELPELDARWSDARSAVAEARQKSEAAELNLFRFLNTQFVRSADGARPATAPAKAEEKRPFQTAVQKPPRPNPEWVELDRQLRDLQKHRGDLLEQLTPAHPAVQELDQRIADLQNKMGAIPANLPDAAESPAADAAQVDDPAARLGANVAPPENLVLAAPSADVLQRQYIELEIAAGRARHDCELAREAETACADAYVQVAQTPRQFAPAVVTQPAGFTVQPRMLALLAVVAVLASVVALAVRRRPVRIFSTPAEVQAALGLPMLARFEAARR